MIGEASWSKENLVKNSTGRFHPGQEKLLKMKYESHRQVVTWGRVPAAWRSCWSALRAATAACGPPSGGGGAPFGRVGLGCGGQKKVPGLVDETWDGLVVGYWMVSGTGVEVEAALL